MKKILIQLDSDKFASTFDCIVAHDAGADVVQSYRRRHSCRMSVVWS